MSTFRRSSQLPVLPVLITLCLSLAAGCQGTMPIVPPGPDSCGENPAEFEPDPDLLCDPEADACDPGMACLLTGCIPSSCACEPSTGMWACTEDCRMWHECQPDSMATARPIAGKASRIYKVNDDCLDRLPECCEIPI